MKSRFLRCLALGLVVGICIPSTLYAKGVSEKESVDVEECCESDEEESIEDYTDEEGIDEDSEDYYDDVEGEDDSDDLSDDEDDCGDEGDCDGEDDCDGGEPDGVEEDCKVSDHMDEGTEMVEVCEDDSDSCFPVEDDKCDDEDSTDVAPDVKNDVECNTEDEEYDDDCSGDFDSCEGDSSTPYIEVDEIVIHYDNGSKGKLPVKKVMSDGSMNVPCSCSSRGSYEDSSKTLHVYNKKELFDRVVKYLRSYSEVAEDDVFTMGNTEYKISTCKLGGKYVHRDGVKSGKEKETLNTKVGEMNHTYFGGSFVETLGGVTIDVYAVPVNSNSELFSREYIESKF